MIEERHHQSIRRREFPQQRHQHQTTPTTPTTTIASELKRVASVLKESPCCCCFLVSDNNDKKNNGYDTAPATTKTMSPQVLTYQSFSKCLQWHGLWLESLLHTVERSIARKVSFEQEQQNHYQNDIVVAYLSSNSVDMLASVVAATDVTTTKKQDATTITTVVLLNTRWTSQEMVAALQPTVVDSSALSSSLSATQSESARNSITIILHDEHFQSTARQVVAGLQAASVRTSTNSQDLQHKVVCMPIPSASNSFVQSYMGEVLHISYGLLPPLPHRTAAVLDHASHEDALIIFTSGTSGGRGPKGVRLSHRSLLVQALTKLDVNSCCCGYTAQSRMLASTVPLFHVGGLNSILACLLAGGCLMFPTTKVTATSSSSSSFRVQDVLASLSLQEPQLFAAANTLVVVPAMLSALFEGMNNNNDLESKEYSKHPTSHRRRCKKMNAFPFVRMILIGGQSASPSLLQQTRRTFPRARIVQTYACTEAASSLTFQDVTTTTASLSSASFDDPSSNSKASIGGSSTVAGDCVGYPPSHVELRLMTMKTEDGGIDRDNIAQNSNTESLRQSFTEQAEDVLGVVTKPYTLGVIATRGPHVMNGYWTQRGNSGHRSGTSFNQHDFDWFVGGDLGYFDEHGRLYFGGRIQDTIRTGGETVLAVEVERVLEKHPAIVECAVFPLPHDKFGEAVVCALVVAEEEENNQTTSSMIVDLASVKGWCRKHGLAGYKHPKSVFRMASLPKNSSGKTLKHKLIAHVGGKEATHRIPSSKL